MSQFAEDVLKGLSASPKYLSSRYFYDDEGSRLFQAIMDLPEYYLTRAEMRVFEMQGDSICDVIADGHDSIDIVELGAGDGSKTAVLIDRLLRLGIGITYSPIDISQGANDELATRFAARFPTMDIKPHTGDYFRVLEGLRSGSGRRKVILFLGSNIGNFGTSQALAFFLELRAAMEPSDMLLIGFDLQKDPRKIVAAYDDSAGVTARFNLNLLRRINRELGGDFDLTKFSHYAQYRPIECAARSFLISRERQTVEIAALGRKFEFDAWEAVFMEISQKYTRAMIADLASESGFKLGPEFLDEEDLFLDSVWLPN